MARGVTIVGIEKLEAKLKDNVKKTDVKRVVAHNGAQMTAKMVDKADFKKGYQTGQTKRSIHMNLTDGGMTAEAGATTHYSEYLEKGTRFMEAQPFVKPAFDEQKEKFKSDMQKLCK